MRFDKLQHQLDLLLLLTENREYTVDDMVSILHLSQRNIYYYLDFFKSADFDIVRRGKYYSISRDSKFIRKLCDLVRFTEDEAITLRHLLAVADGNDMQIRKLRDKFDRFYDFDIIENTPVRLHQQEVMKKIYHAIKERYTICIHDYSSSNSKSVTDRIVEPFLLMNGSNDVRAYELSSGLNKTFKLSRMGRVEVLDKHWENQKEHRTMYNDLFNFSSETLIPITLKLDMLSRTVLLEEYPLAERDLEGDTLKTKVCSLIGIGRFVLGLYDHIEIIDSPKLRDYIHDKLIDFRKLETTRVKDVAEKKKQEMRAAAAEEKLMELQKNQI